MVSTLTAVVGTHVGTRCAFTKYLSHTDRMKIIKIFWPGMGDCRLGGALCFVSLVFLLSSLCLGQTILVPFQGKVSFGEKSGGASEEC